MASPCISSVCAVCCEQGTDRRLLTCLHSCCASCIDQLALRSESGDFDLQCPLCRTRVRLPPDGAAGLPKDPTQSEVEEHACSACKDEGQTGKAAVWCSKCKCALCTNHVVAHLMSGSGPSSHLVGDLPKSSMTSDAEKSASLCKEHGSPLKYFCQRCNVAVCGDCIAIGAHQGHRPVVLTKDVNAELHAKVQAKAQRLKTVALPRAESAITNVDQVTVELSKGAKKLRGEVRAAAERAVNTIRASEQQKLQEIDDIEVVRLKVLDRQKDELKRHTEALKTAIALTDKLAQGQEGGGKAAGRLLEALDKRTTELERAKISDSPERHSHISFETVSDDDLIAKANELVGTVIPCEASAQHSFVEGDHNQTAQEGQSATFTVVAKDDKGNPLAQGGDLVRATVSRKPAKAGNLPPVEVKDNGNGRYDIHCATPCAGEYTVEISVNGSFLANTLSVTCRNQLDFHFDQAQCHANITISPDKLTMTHTGRNGYSSVLGSRGVRRGQHSWKVRVNKSQNMDVFVGVMDKHKRTGSDDYKRSYSWHGYDGKKWENGKCTSSIGSFQVNDVIQLDVDCDTHTLRIFNHRSGETAMIAGLPDVQLFPYFETFYQDASLTLIWRLPHLPQAV